MLGLASNYPSGGALSPLWAGPEYLPVRTQARTLSKLQVATGAVLHGHDARTTAGDTPSLPPPAGLGQPAPRLPLEVMREPESAGWCTDYLGSTRLEVVVEKLRQVSISGCAEVYTIDRPKNEKGNSG